MTSVIRPLTLPQRKRPAHKTFVGGFKNVSFQIGQLIKPEVTIQNTNETTPSYSKAIFQKSETIKFPVKLPNSITPLKGEINMIGSITGQKNVHGGYDAFFTVRGTERLSSFNSKLRTVNDLLRMSESAEPNEDTRLGKSSDARSHNQVMLAGVVVGARFEDGANPKFHIDLRQDSNPNNVIPLSFESKNASALEKGVKYGTLIYVDGEYAFRSVPVYEVDENNKVKVDSNGVKIAVLNAEGLPTKRVHSYIRIQAPKVTDESDTNFGKEYPAWILEIAKEITAARTRSSIERTARSEAKAATLASAAATSTVAIETAMSDL
jgi:hypothetical protein